MRINHIGIVTDNIDKSKALYERLGYVRKSEVIIDEIQSNRLLFMESFDKTQVIELIESIDERSTVYNFPNGYHHICYEVEDVEELFKRFKEWKIGKIFSSRIKACAFDNREVVFAYLTNGVFVEFLLP